jgi:hypothetical protein
MLLVASATSCSSGSNSTRDTVAVTNVVGRTRTEAIGELAAHHLVAVTKVVTSGNSPGIVVAQSPAPGFFLKQNSTVTISVSASPVSLSPAVTKLGKCQRNYPAITDTFAGMNAGIRGLGRTLVPIAAVKVRLCQWSFVTKGYPLIGSDVLANQAATKFENETNRLPTLAAGTRPPICHEPPTSVFVATYARDKQRVQIYEAGCGYITNGTLYAYTSTTWLGQLRIYTTPGPVPQSTHGNKICCDNGHVVPSA